MTANAAGRHLILFDGTCGLCHRCVRFVLARDPKGVFHFAPLQDSGAQVILDRYGRDTGDLDTSYVVVNFNEPDEQLLAQGSAGVFVLGALGWPWKLLALFRFLPSGLLDWGYDRIAGNRHHFFSRENACPVQPPEHRSRFPKLHG